VNATEIIAGLQQHCPHAWEALHHQFWYPVVAILSHHFPRLTAVDEVRDVVSTTLLTVAKQIEAGTIVRAEFLRGYVLRIARRKAFELLDERRRFLLASECDRARRDKGHDPSEEGASGSVFDRTDPQPDPEQRWWMARQFERLQSAFEQLLPKDRELLERYYFRGEDKVSLLSAFAWSPFQFETNKKYALLRLTARFHGLESTYNPDTRKMYTCKELRAKVATC